MTYHFSLLSYGKRKKKSHMQKFSLEQSKIFIWNFVFTVLQSSYGE